MGKRVNFFMLIFTLLLFLTVFWGCSDTNPVDNQSVYLSVDDNVGANDNIDEPKDGDGPPALPADYGKTADPAVGQHLYFDLTRTLLNSFTTKEVAINGGVLSTSLDGKLFSLTVLPHHMPAGTEFAMNVFKGFNKFGEELFLFNFTPSGEDFFYDPILQFEDEPNIGQNPTPSYTLYYQAAGTWVSYGTIDAQTSGVVQFLIPHFSNFAVLKRGGIKAPIDNLVF